MIQNSGKRLRLSGGQADADALREAAGVIASGGVIVYPTETIYGIGANALDSAAVARVRRAKRRPDDKPILVIIPSFAALERIACDVDAKVENLARLFWPGPLTLVLRARKELSEGLTAGTGTVGVRVPSHPACLSLLALTGSPLTSTSANISGDPMPRSFDDIVGVLPSGVDLYLDAGTLPESRPSTVIDMTRERPRLVRAGATPVETLIRSIPDLEIPA